VLLAAATETAPASERLDLARRALALVEGRQDAAELQALLALARSLSVAGRAADALAAMARAKALFEGDLAHDPELLLAAIDTVVVVDPDDDGFTRAMLDRATAAARGHAVMVLPRALLHSAWLEFAAGRWTAAYLGFVEAARLADETALPRERTAAVAGRALLDALQGREEAARAAVHELPVATAQRILGLLELGNGRGDVAAEHLARIADDGPEPLLLRGLPPAALDLTEAYLRGGRREEAAASATAIGDDDPSAAWAAALLGDAAAFERAALRTANLSLSRARIALNRGEALRRAGTRRDARKELEAALELFDALGAAPWAERARQELRASGASIRPREPSAAETLTPQELQVARTVATEASYKEAAAKLFLSPKTVEYHLHKVYRKLGITSGRQLMQRLSDEGLLE
jgi:DNA-binding CsgD family transcriptional regulator